MNLTRLSVLLAVRKRNIDVFLPRKTVTLVNESFLYNKINILCQFRVILGNITDEYRAKCQFTDQTNLIHLIRITITYLIHIFDN